MGSGCGCLGLAVGAEGLGLRRANLFIQNARVICCAQLNGLVGLIQVSSVIHVINLHVGPVVCTLVIQEAVLGDFVLVDQRGRGSNAHVVLHDVDIIIMRAHYDAAVINILDHLQLLAFIRVLGIDDNLVIFPGGLILGSFFWV